MSAPGLQSFLDGTTPHPSTLRKAEAWYVREAARDGVATEAETASAALAILIRDLPRDRRGEAIRQTLDLFDALYAAERNPPPAWLQDLREELARGA